jgi:hypothetical protein
MGRTKPNKPSKSPNKRIEEQDEQEPSIKVTPKPATARKNTTETEQSESPQKKSYREKTQIQNIYKNNTSMINHMDKMDQERKLKGQYALYREDDSLTTMDIIEHLNNQEDSTRLRCKLSVLDESKRNRTPKTRQHKDGENVCCLS